MQFKRSSALYCAVLSILYYFFALYLLFDEAKTARNNGNLKFDKLSYLEQLWTIVSVNNQFNFISKIGVCIISALSGFGCVFMPFEYFRYFNPLISKINKEKIEDDMRIIISEIHGDMVDLASLTEN